MNEAQIREILAQEYDKQDGMERIAAVVRDPASNVDMFKFEGAALAAMRRVRDFIVNECANAADDLVSSIKAKAE